MQPIQGTYSIKEGDIAKKWILIDAEGKRLGRMATQIATILRGKHKPEFTPHMDMGDFVIVVNAEKVELTGTKAEDKEYFKHTEYPGGKKFTNIKKIMKENPALVIEYAVKGMIPKNRLGRKVMKNLKIYAGSDHPHGAQQPEKLDF